MTAHDVVTVRGLRKTYGTRNVVNSLDLDVRGGEVVGLLGANGAGKTTTVECIQGLRKADAGSLNVLGFDPATQAAQLRPLIGSQLQDSALPDRLRVSEALRLFATAGSRQHGDELLRQFGLADRRRSVFSSLSGGERQRLFLVLALLNCPRLVILDELTQGLDPAARREVWAAVRRLRDAGTTVLLVTHEVDEAEALCDRVVVMRAGRVVDAGTPAELVNRYARTATIRFALPAEAAGLPGEPMALLDELRQIDGVRGLERSGLEHGGLEYAGLDRSGLECSGADVTVHGDRRIIAHVGASLVRHGMVPGDLGIHVPSLEDAVLTLLEPGPDDARDGPASPVAPDELVGGRR